MPNQNQNKEKTLKEFDELVSSGRLHLNFGYSSNDTTIEDLTDEDKLNLMKYINEIEKRENEQK